jgi:hypothetical protein
VAVGEGGRAARVELQHGGEKVHRRGVVVERCSGWRHDGTRKQVVDLVRGQHPVIVFRHAAALVPLEPAGHCEQVADGDGGGLGIQGRQRRVEQLSQGLAPPPDGAALDGDAHQQRDHALGHRPERVQRIGAAAGEVLLGDQVPVADDEYAPEAGDRRRLAEGGGEGRAVHTLGPRGRRAPLGGQIDGLPGGRWRRRVAARLRRSEQEGEREPRNGGRGGQRGLSRGSSESSEHLPCSLPGGLIGRKVPQATGKGLVCDIGTGLRASGRPGIATAGMRRAAVTTGSGVKVGGLVVPLSLQAAAKTNATMPAARGPRRRWREGWGEGSWAGGGPVARLAKAGLPPTFQPTTYSARAG